MANGAFKFKDNSGNVVSFISGSGSNISFSGGTLDLSGMTGLTLGNLTLSGTTQNALSASHAASYLLTSSFNTYSGTTDTLIGTLQTSTGSLNSFTSSATTRLNSIETSTGSLNSYTSSNNTKLGVIESTTGSLNSYTSSNTTNVNAIHTSTGSLNTFTSSATTRLDNIETSTGSLNSFTSSATTRLNSIEGVSGSYATTGSNQFKNNQVITGSLTVTGFIDAQELRTTYISSSILYRSGSTKFGDELTDTHAFTGSLLVSGSISVPGSNLVSGSSQVLNGSGVFSGSAQLPSGIVSSSAQTIANLPSGTVSGSVQVDVMSTTNIARLATTGSNTFTGALTGTSATFTSNITINAAATNGLILQNSAGGESPNVSFITPVNKYNIDANAIGNLRFFTENTDGSGGVVRANLDASGSLGLGVTPSAWASGFTALQVKNATFWSTGNDASITSNAYYDGTNYRYIGTAGATKVYHNTDGSINWAQAASGAAGNPITFTTAMVLDSTGRLGVGYDTPAYQLQVLNTIGLRANNQNIQAIKGTGWGYSPSTYKVVMLGDTANNVTVSIGYDPSGNSNSAFNGGGGEVLFRNGASFATPTSGNTAFHLNNLVLKDGGVGIGVVPSYPLDLTTSSSGTFNTIAQFQNTDYTAGNRSFLRVRAWASAGGSYSSYFGTGQDGNLYMIANNSARGGDLIINAGTGAVTMSNNLSINGKLYGAYGIISSNFIAGNIASNMPSAPAYILILDLNDIAGFSMSGKVNAASYTCWNISDIWVEKDYSSMVARAGIEGKYKSGCDFSIVDISYGAGRYIAFRFTSNPEIDVMLTGYRLTNQVSGGAFQVVTSGVSVNSTYASY